MPDCASHDPAHARRVVAHVLAETLLDMLSERRKPPAKAAKRRRRSRQRAPQRT